MGQSERNNNSEEKPVIDGIEPRISYCNISQCIRCGKCQSSHYCDSFLDRSSSKQVLVPVMDSRNCTGCGLCVQLCEKGALQLYKPEEMLVLISSSQERKAILQFEGIPFLAYDPICDLDRFSEHFPKLVKKAKNACDVGLIDTDKFNELIINLTAHRLEEKFILGHKREQLYPDKRIKEEARFKEWQKAHQSLLGVLTHKDASLDKHGSAIENRTIYRAIIWSLLIWSDPGQVLWDSHILALQTVLKTENKIMDAESCNTIIDYKKFKDKKIQISTYAVLMRQGRTIFHGWIDSDAFQLADISEKDWRQYCAKGIGNGRLAGLDTRTCGDFLIKEYKAIKPEDRQAMAGMPWLKLKSQVDDQHKIQMELLRCKIKNEEDKQK